MIQSYRSSARQERGIVDNRVLVDHLKRQATSWPKNTDWFRSARPGA